MATIAEVRDRAGSDLGMLRLNQTLQAQDSTRITTGYNEVYADLQEDGLATWTSTGDIPTECVPHVVALVANNCLGTYSVSKDRYLRIKAAAEGPTGDNAKRQIRRLITPSFVSATDPADF